MNGLVNLALQQYIKVKRLEEKTDKESTKLDIVVGKMSMELANEYFKETEIYDKRQADIIKLKEQV